MFFCTRGFFISPASKVVPGQIKRRKVDLTILENKPSHGSFHTTQWLSPGSKAYVYCQSWQRNETNFGNMFYFYVVGSLTSGSRFQF